MNATMDKKAALLSGFPAQVKYFAASFPKALAMAELVQFLFVCAGCVMCMCALLSWHRFRLSRNLLAMSWLFGFIAPFATMLFFPYRTAVDWTGILHYLCETTIQSSLSSSPEIKLLFANYAAINQDMPEWHAG